MHLRHSGCRVEQTADRFSGNSPLRSTSAMINIDLSQQEGGSKMKAAELGELLENLGVPVLGYREDDGYLGGLIRVTDTIHVEMGEEGDACVVKAVEKDFLFYESRAHVEELIYDLVNAGAVVLH
jgi:hypothetical protein